MIQYLAFDTNETAESQPAVAGNGSTLMDKLAGKGGRGGR